MDYYYPENKDSLAKAVGASTLNQQKVVNPPKVGDKILLQLHPWGMFSIVDPKTIQSSGQYFEAEITAERKVSITIE